MENQNQDPEQQSTQPSSPPLPSQPSTQPASSPQPAPLTSPIPQSVPQQPAQQQFAQPQPQFVATDSQLPLAKRPEFKNLKNVGYFCLFLSILQALFMLLAASMAPSIVLISPISVVLQTIISLVLLYASRQLLSTHDSAKAKKLLTGISFYGIAGALIALFSGSLPGAVTAAILSIYSQRAKKDLKHASPVV